MQNKRWLCQNCDTLNPTTYSQCEYVVGAPNQMYIVTIKLPKNKKHDPKNKQVGFCPVSKECTDVTGEHHSVLVTTEEQMHILTNTYHITRIEKVHNFDSKFIPK